MDFKTLFLTKMFGGGIWFYILSRRSSPEGDAATLGSCKLELMKIGKKG